MLRNFWLLVLFIFLFSCRENTPATTDFYESELFKAVQLEAVFPDSKTFVDCTPRRSLPDILALYDEEKSKPGFNLKQFVVTHFSIPVPPVTNFKTDQNKAVEDHILSLWPVLTRQPDDYNSYSSLIPLPHDYIVPGGRFAEIYYWDSYFTILGLKASGRIDLVRNMVDNFAFLIDSLGFIPNGNRKYYLSRSQPPYFSLMVAVLAEDDEEALSRYLPVLEKEYDFWMQGEEKLEFPGDALGHVVKLSDGTVVNRYWDHDPRPRPEAYKEDVHLQQQSARPAEDLYRNLRSACESGWDFSARWFEKGKGLESIRTTELIPVDLNCLLYHHELLLAQAFRKKDKADKAREFAQRADQRRRAIVTFMWSPETKYFYDYHFPTEQRSDVATLAGTFPLYFNLVSGDVAKAVGEKLSVEFLAPGGLKTTLIESGQQWDAPNDWAPLQWIAYTGMRNYGLNEVAEDIKKRWLAVNTRVYFSTGKMMEKYNVMDTTMVAGGGEYPNQDGFGWTNGVFMVMTKEK